MRYFNIHNHTDYSNNRFLDSMNTVPELYKNAKAKGMAGIAITDHGVVIPAAVQTAQMMDSHPEFFNGKDGKGTFKPVVGSEIYLDDFNIIKNAVDNNKKTKFFHFVLTAKDDIGLHALRIISSNSWGASHLENIENDHPKYHAFFFRGMRRLPTYKDWLSKLMHDPQFHFKGHVIASTACLGSELSQSIVNDNKSRAKKFINYIEDTFGKNQCYFEMMPAHRPAQEKVNRTLWNISHGRGYFDDDTGKGIPCIISTDAHYIDKRDRQAHSIFLKSENPNRDVKDFYQYAHLFTYDELKSYFPQNVLDTACKNSLKLLSRYAPIWHANNEDKMKKVAKEHPNHPPVRLHYLQEIPDIPMPKVVKPVNLDYYAKKYNVNWNKYPYFHMFTTSPHKEDRYYMQILFKGIHKRHIPFNDTYLKEINWELMTLHQLTVYFHEPMSSYFLTVLNQVVKSIWNCKPRLTKEQKRKLPHDRKLQEKVALETGSLLGPGRGSAGEWVTSYIIGITQVNSVKWKLWAPRFECGSRARSGDMPDIDLDSESSKRLDIMHYLKVHRGYDRVLNFSTFNTQAAKSTIYTCCRGMHINYIQAQNIANLLPADARGMGNISLHDALFGNKKNGIKPAKPFIRAVRKYPGLEEALKGVSQRIRGVSEHASGVALFNEPYTQRNSMMKTNKAPGIAISGGDAPQSAYLSSLKYDYLTLSALDRLHEAVRLLLRDHKIKWLGNLHDTYLHYFGPQALDFTSPKMYDMLYDGQVTNAFEFNSLVGRRALLTVQAHDFPALVASNALMRLTVDHGEQPIDKFVRYVHHPEQWDEDMKKYGLNKEERQVMHKHLGRHHGVCYCQEDLMKLSMDSKISGFKYSGANVLRKAVAKKDPKIFNAGKKKFYAGGKKQGTRKVLLDYVWNECAVPSKNYSFNLAHGVAYTIILIIEMNICYRFGAIYWQTACLSVNAGMYGDSVESFKNPDYNKLCHALSNKYIASKLIHPSINHSGYGFVPYHNHILYGLYPISGIGADVATKIIKNRPYSSFDDFLKKTQLSKRENIQLIKAGCFDDFNTNHDKDFRIKLMAKYVSIVKPLKKRLTMTQVPKVRQYIPSKYNKMVRVFDFRSKITGRHKIPMNKDIEHEFLTKYAKYVEPYAHKGQTSLFKNPSKADTMSYITDKKGNFKINVKAFNKWYNKYVKPLKDWLKTKPALVAEARKRRAKLWFKYCYGDQSTWEMDALGCYIGTHELDNTPLKEQYNITDYSKVPKQENFNQNHPRAIYGTVIGKNANKHLVYLLTPQGIANVRVSKRRYSAYNKRNKKVTNNFSNNSYLNKIATKAFKGSWFSRGNRLLTRGSKVGDNFFINWNEKKYPLYFIVNYDKDAKAVDLHGNPAPTKPQYRQNSGFMRHKQYQRNQQIMHRQEQRRNQASNQMINQRNKQIDKEFNQIADKGKLSSVSQIVSKSNTPNSSFDNNLTSICKSLNADFSNPNWTIPTSTSSVNQSKEIDNNSNNLNKIRNIERICINLNRKFNG